MVNFFEEFERELKKQGRITKEEIFRLKNKLAAKHKLAKIPSNYEIMLETRGLKQQLLTKPTRTISGVAVVAIMTKPRRCPHGKCVMCPGGPESVFGNVPQSYTGREPATMRATRNHFDPYLQVFNRLEQYTLLGHNINKIELIVMGGTFPAYPWDYQQEFIANAFKAMNDFAIMFYRAGKLNLEKFKDFFELPADIHDRTRVAKIQRKILKLKGVAKLTKEQKRNERANIRCVALCIETRPDYCRELHIKRMLQLGTTRVELGVQSLDDRVLAKIKRGHTVQDSIVATALLRKYLLKVGYHIMIGLPGSSKDKDIHTFKLIFDDERFRPDFLKIYPCVVTKGTELYSLWKLGKYKPLTVQETVEIIRQSKRFIPEYCRIMRVQRDIPESTISAGPKMSNLRQFIHQQVVKCRCIRCREFGSKLKQGLIPKVSKAVIKVIEYEAASGREYFIESIDKTTDTLFGYCRLRIARPSGLRELHVFGPSVGFGKKGMVQHRGLGRQLLLKAEEIAKKQKQQEVLIISGIGVREYYRKFGYRKKGFYMAKKLQ